MNQLDVIIKNYEGGSVIWLSGKLNIESVEIFEKKTSECIKDELSVLFINFSKLMFIDSSGVGSLIKFNNRVKIHSGKIIIYNLSEPIKKIFKRAYLDRFFTVQTVAQLRNNYPGIDF